jgi:hypothetical protein
MPSKSKTKRATKERSRKALDEKELERVSGGYLSGAPGGQPRQAVPHDGDYDVHAAKRVTAK